MYESEVTSETEIKETMIHKDELFLEQYINKKGLMQAYDLAIKSGKITFDEKLALRLLQLAIELKDEQYVNNLILRIPSLNTEEGGKLIWQALSIWSVKIATTLVKAGAKLSVRNPYGEKKLTLLHVMATIRNTGEYYDLALLMMDHGADVNATDTAGRTALHYAVVEQPWPDEYSFVLAAELVHRGARVDAVDNRGYSVIDFAKLNFEFDGQLTPLLIALADVDDDVKCRWIFEAIVAITKESEYNLDGLKSLLELGFPVLKMNGVFTNVWEPLYFAVSLGKKEQMEIILDYGLDVNVKFNTIGGVTSALHVALRNNFKRIASILIERGADIRAIDGVSREPIHEACQSNLTKSVRLLLRLGADINIADSFGRTPYSMINRESQSDALRKCLIERFAILAFSGIKIKEEVEKSFLGDSRLCMYLKKCLNELKMMKTVKINHDISLFCLLTKSVKNVSYFARNNDFTKNFHDIKQKFDTRFPVYFKELEYIVKMAQARKNIILSKEVALLDVLDFPQLVITKIAKYASFDDLVDFEKRYHIYKKIK